MRIIGQILLWLGFLSGALATVFQSQSSGVKYVKGLRIDEQIDEGGKALIVDANDRIVAEASRFELPDLSGLEIPTDGWNLVPWTWYLISVGIAVAGVVMLYVSKASEGQKSEKTQADLKEIEKALKSLINNTTELHKQLDDLAPSKITKYIDDVLAEDCRIFAEGRDSITAEHGLPVFAEVMSQFAAGERAINRAWSAAADGYVDETSTCIERAEKMLRSAHEELVAAGNRTS